MKEAVTIIGAGIGGLTTALTLKQRGVKFDLFEAADEIRPVGAGIILANNAMQVFRELGVQSRIEKAGNKISRMKITDARLHTISLVDLTKYEQKYGVHNVAIHRGKLQEILAEEVSYEFIHLSKRLSKIERADSFKLTFEDDSVVETRLVIGADGLKSAVRNQLFKENTLRNANQKCWRGICDMELHQNYHGELNEAWGRGKRFGFVKIGDEKVYWYALINSKRIVSDEVNLLEWFSEFHSDILNIIAATAKEKIVVSDIFDLKPINKWQDKNVCLVGDAAHATTPNMGQGACQAVEDAFTLGRLLNKGFAIEDTFEVYETLRRKKAHVVVNTSWTIGKIAHVENRIGAWWRNVLMKLLPESTGKKQMDMIFNINNTL